MREYRQAHVTLRLPKPLRAWIADQAEVNDRSLNQEMVFRLELAKLDADRASRAAGTPAAGSEA